MARGRRTPTVSLNEEHAAKLSRLVQRTHVREGTLPRSLLSHAIDGADVDPDNVVQILDGISEAFERAQLGLEQARDRQPTPLDEF